MYNSRHSTRRTTDSLRPTKPISSPVPLSRTNIALRRVRLLPVRILVPSFAVAAENVPTGSRNGSRTITRRLCLPNRVRYVVCAGSSTLSRFRTTVSKCRRNRSGDRATSGLHSYGCNISVVGNPWVALPTDIASLSSEIVDRERRWFGTSVCFEPARTFEPTIHPDSAVFASYSIQLIYTRRNFY